MSLLLTRTLEPEVMDDPARTSAYAQADFSEVNQIFVDRFLAAFPNEGAGNVLDLGCGPADIPIRLGRKSPNAHISAVDASEEMLRLAQDAVATTDMEARIKLIHGRIPNLPLSPRSFDAVISNSLLHHLPDPLVFWAEIQRLAKPGAAVFIMDLFRPESMERAQKIVETTAAHEHPLLKEDFLNSLLAAFTLDEIYCQLRSAKLTKLRAQVASDRHWLISGHL